MTIGHRERVCGLPCETFEALSNGCLAIHPDGHHGQCFAFHLSELGIHLEAALETVGQIPDMGDRDAWIRALDAMSGAMGRPT